MRNLFYESKAGTFVLVLLLVMAFSSYPLFAADAADEPAQAEVLTPVQRKLQQKLPSIEFKNLNSY